MSRGERREGSGDAVDSNGGSRTDAAPDTERSSDGHRTGVTPTGGPPETLRIDPRPSRTGTALAGLVGLVAVAAQAAGGPAVVVGGVGLVALVGGLQRGVRPLVSVGVLGLIVGVLVAGAAGAPTELLLVSAAASAVAWDVADQAVSLGEQVGRGADTERAELVHAAGSALVATAAVAAAYIVFQSVTGGPILSLVLLLFGAVLLASVLRG